MAHRLICPVACGIFPNQASNLCLLHWQMDSLPLRHQGSPYKRIFKLAAAAAAATAKSLQSCLTVRPHRWQPSRLPHTKDSPGKNTGMGCISFSNAWSQKWKWSRSVMSNSSRPHGLQPTRLFCPWDFPRRVLEWVAIAFSISLHIFVFLIVFSYSWLLILLHCDQKSCLRWFQCFWIYQG